MRFRSQGHSTELLRCYLQQKQDGNALDNFAFLHNCCKGKINKQKQILYDRWQGGVFELIQPVQIPWELDAIAQES